MNFMVPLLSGMKFLIQFLWPDEPFNDGKQNKQSKCFPSQLFLIKTIFMKKV